jgi:purine-binding chemotaxis protein CheW
LADSQPLVASLSLRAGLEGPSLALVVFDVDGQRYALHLAAVERAIPMVAVSPLPDAPAIALGVINLHGTVIPVVDLRRRLGCPPRDYGLTTHLLVARTKHRRLAVPVDQVLGVREVAATSVTRPDAVLAGLAHVSGIVALSDGLLFIHDLDGFLSLDEGRQLAEAMKDVAE